MLVVDGFKLPGSTTFPPSKGHAFPPPLFQKRRSSATPEEVPRTECGLPRNVLALIGRGGSFFSLRGDVHYPVVVRAGNAPLSLVNILGFPLVRSGTDFGCKEFFSSLS